MSLLKISDDVMWEMVLYLPVKDLLQLKNICTNFHQLINNPSFQEDYSRIHNLHHGYLKIQIEDKVNDDIDSDDENRDRDSDDDDDEDRNKRVTIGNITYQTGTWILGLCDGHHEYLDDDDNVIIGENYYYGKLHGVQKYWLKNDNLLIENIYKYGVRHGLQRRWYSNGQMQLKQNYKYGKLDEVREYHHNGSLLSIQSYVDEKKHGCGQKWFNDGFIQNEMTYCYGKPEGCHYEWDNVGHLIYLINYTHDDNVYKFNWNGNGMLISIKQYKISYCKYEPLILHGLQRKFWYHNGSLRSDSYYENGRKCTYRAWHSNGYLLPCSY